MKNENVVVNQNCHSRVFLSGIPTLDTQRGGDPRVLRTASSGMTTNFKEEALNKNDFRAPLRSGFTLIELLVVILIIGILAAIALPQYQKAVEKARAMEGIAILKKTFEAADFYYLEHGSWPTKLEDLEIQFPGWTGTTKGYTGVVSGSPALSNRDWSLQLFNTNVKNNEQHAVYITRLSGPYAGALFQMWRENKLDANPQPLDKVICYERSSDGIIFHKNPGAFCKKIMNGVCLNAVCSSAVIYF